MKLLLILMTCLIFSSVVNAGEREERVVSFLRKRAILTYCSYESPINCKPLIKVEGSAKTYFVADMSSDARETLKIRISNANHVPPFQIRIVVDGEAFETIGKPRYKSYPKGYDAFLIHRVYGRK